MLSKARFQSLLRFSRKKGRIVDGQFFVDGWRWLAEATVMPGILQCVVAVPGVARTESEHHLLQRAKRAAGEFHEALPDQVAKLAGTVTSPGLVALVKWSPVEFSHLARQVELPGCGLVAVLDSVGDPGNAGTIIRTADWFGARGVVFGRGTVEPSNPKLVRSTMGSLFHLPVAVSDRPGQDLENLRAAGFITVGAVLGGEDAMDFEWPERVALVIGNEANGVSDDVAAILHHRVSIPSFGRAESLNAAVAFAILAGQWRSRHRPAVEPGVSREQEE